jgi:hypothetical protein
MAETTRVRRAAVTHQLDVGRYAWAAICAGVYYVSVREKRNYSLADSLDYMFDKIISGEIPVDDSLICEFLDEVETSKGVAINLAIAKSTNQMLGAIRDRMQTVSDRRITTPQVVHFALALAPRPLW